MSGGVRLLSFHHSIAYPGDIDFVCLIWFDRESDRFPCRWIKRKAATVLSTSLCRQFKVARAHTRNSRTSLEKQYRKNNGSSLADFRCRGEFACSVCIRASTSSLGAGLSFV